NEIRAAIEKGAIAAGGTTAVFTLEQWNELLSIAVAVITISYLLMQIVVLWPKFQERVGKWACGIISKLRGWYEKR
ncbi:MAG: hypothetical protein CMM94_08465, partial [Rickettsiales bacterium]|nr:hypothetical protein [Rickettsiales bacterium]